MIIKNEHNLGDIVYLRTDPNQLERIVTAIQLRPGTIIYGLSWSDERESFHYSIEITNEKTLIL